MSMADELQKLQQLRESGALSESEFHEAKRKVLDGVVDSAPAPLTATAASRSAVPSQPSPSVDDDSLQSLGRAANIYVETQRTSSRIGMVVGVVGLVVFLFVALAMCSQMGSVDDPGPGSISCTGPDFIDC